MLRPARGLRGVEVAAVASRSRDRARRFAAAHGIPRAHEGYASLLANSDVDAVYNALPVSLHCEWTVRALEAGKHVLREKPFAANALEARQMQAASRLPGTRALRGVSFAIPPARRPNEGNRDVGS